ncbi:MAG TPA: S-layer homology domain-containing protein [Anaerolineae bacterium]|nr:S-layer homology domain-containing protein [Anaerolineae bacterium]
MSKWPTFVICLVMGLAGSALGQYVFGQEEEPLHRSGAEYYEDVSAESPHADDIGFAREAGIARGFSDTEYGPGWVVSREQMATFEMRDFTAGIVFALRVVDLARFRDEKLGSLDWYWFGPDGIRHDTEEEKAFWTQWGQDQGDMLLWMADLIEHEDGARPADAVGRADEYSVVAERLRSLGWWTTSWWLTER